MCKWLSKYKWCIIDLHGNLLSTKTTSLSPSKENNFTVLSKNYYKHNQQLFYWNNYNDTVCSIDHNNSFHLLLKRNRVAQNDNIKATTNKKMITEMFESKNYLWVKFFENNKNKIAICNKLSKEINTANAELQFDNSIGLVNDIDYLCNFYPKYHFEEKENFYLVQTIDALDLKELKFKWLIQQR